MVLEDLTEDKLRKMTDKAVFERGRRYFSSGYVRKIWLEDNVLLAKVMGSQGMYQVRIEETKSQPEFYCSCPYGGFCKHIVAVALTFLKNTNEITSQAKESERRNKSIKEQLLQLEKEDLADLLLLSIKTHKDWKMTFLKGISKKLLQISKDQSKSIYEEQFYSLFDRVCEILEEHNEYGGGPEEEEDEVFKGLDEIVNLFKEHKLTPILKQKFIDKMFYYYDLDNSGLEDYIWEAVFDIAETRNDWMHIIRKLEAQNNPYRKTLIEQICKEKLKE